VPLLPPVYSAETRKKARKTALPEMLFRAFRLFCVILHLLCQSPMHMFLHSSRSAPLLQKAKTRIHI
jgi:hypothetical protein